MRLSFCGISLLLLLPCLVLGATTGEHAADFLNVGVGARAIGLGGSFVAVADDATAAYWNPAGLTRIPSHAFSAMYADAFQANSGGFFSKGLVNYSFMNYVTRLNTRDTMGLSWIRMGIDDIPYTTFEDTNGNGILGDFLDTNDNGVKEPGEYYLDRPIIAEMFNNTDDALLFSYARKVSNRFSLGGNLKLVRQSLYENHGTGWGVDIGLLVDVLEGLRTALVIQDATGTRITWDTPDSPTFTRKLSIHWGAAYQRSVPVIGSLAIGLDVRNNRKDVDQGGGKGWQVHYGLEYWLLDVVALRIGAAQTRFAAGAGLRIPLANASIRADYAFSTHELGDSQRLSITGQF